MRPWVRLARDLQIYLQVGCKVSFKGAGRNDWVKLVAQAPTGEQVGFWLVHEGAAERLQQVVDYRARAS